MGFFKDFKSFISKGNIVDMAVGVVIGGSFGKIVTGLVEKIINPFVGIFIKDGNLSSIKTVITKADEANGIAENAILWGDWLQTVIDFLITALCVFIVLRIIMKAKNKLEAKKIAEDEAKKKAEEEKAAAAKEAAEAKQAALEASILKQTELLEQIAAKIK